MGPPSIIMSGPIVNEDPLHLIATYDPAEQDETPLQKQLSRTISREDQDTSSPKSPNVYVDELAGSDTHGTGTKQAPFQTIYGAFKHRGADAHIFVKRRCVESKTKYWVPTDQGVDLDLMRLPTRDRAAESEAPRPRLLRHLPPETRSRARSLLTNPRRRTRAPLLLPPRTARPPASPLKRPRSPRVALA